MPKCDFNKVALQLIYFVQIVIELSVRKSFVLNFKRDISSANILHIYFIALDKSLT